MGRPAGENVLDYCCSMQWPNRIRELKLGQRGTDCPKDILPFSTVLA